ncbi:AraC family transcriptional regulator [Nocardia pseudobrasiliensis]|uniref:AraC family transcriptional regulator n=2 Tax=Nocardia pseudobrasiliensis TaxID=45979 RepID=A0A370I5G6_9NOCA|nr:AraC family transcriptional regulator [Nocardia pseudobrasiliensis]
MNSIVIALHAEKLGDHRQDWDYLRYMNQAARLVRHQGGVPVYGYRSDPLTPPVSLMRYDPSTRPTGHPHIHDFPVLWYSAASGTVCVVAAGEVVDGTAAGIDGMGTAVMFDPAALGEDARAPWPAWHSHPLLYPFLHGRRDGLLRLTIPPERRPLWDNAIAAIEAELTERHDGYRQATRAHLTLLLIDLSRIAADVVGDLRRSGEPLLAEVFDIIDKRHHEPLSLSDIARTVNLTPGYLTTVVRHRTGRTVQDWILHHRMTQARRLLTETTLPISEIARRVGLPDPGYFTRQFRRTHGLPPRTFRINSPT